MYRWIQASGMPIQIVTACGAEQDVAAELRVSDPLSPRSGM